MRQSAESWSTVVPYGSALRRAWFRFIIKGLVLRLEFVMEE